VKAFWNYETCWACKGVPSVAPYDPCMICKGKGKTPVEPSVWRKALSKWPRQAWDRLVDSYYFAAMAIFALAEAAMAIIEFVLHILKIPHWH
jgi:hypothetical protein